MKSISLNDFMKVLEEDNSKSFEEFFDKLQEKSRKVDMEEVKQILHKEVDKLKTENDLRIFCLKMGETVFDYFREVVIKKEL